MLLVPQVFLPEGYLAGVYREMRTAGAVCVADEVQCGFGRVGRAFWAFELQGVVPDIVTFGEPRLHSRRGAARWQRAGQCVGCWKRIAVLTSRQHRPVVCQHQDAGLTRRAIVRCLRAQGMRWLLLADTSTTAQYPRPGPACLPSPQASPAATASPWRAW